MKEHFCSQAVKAQLLGKASRAKIIYLREYSSSKDFKTKKKKKRGLGEEQV